MNHAGHWQKKKKKKQLLGNVVLGVSFQSSLQNDPSQVSVSDSVGSRGKQNCLGSHQQGAEVSLCHGLTDGIRFYYVLVFSLRDPF